MRTFTTLVLSLSLLLPALASAASPPKPEITRSHIDAALAAIPKYAPDRILVRFTPGTPAASIAQSHRVAKGLVQRTIPGINVQVVKVPKGQVVAKLRAYRANPNVEFAEPDYNRLLVIPTEGTDPPPPIGTGVEMFPEQWGLNNTGQILIDPIFGIPSLTGTPDADIDAPEGWDIHTGDASVKIAILDSGVDCNSVDLAGKCVEQISFVTDFSPTTDDLVAHGTHVAGIAAANTDNGKGTAGVGWNSSIGNLKACYEYELEVIPDIYYIVVGVCPVSSSADAITHAANNGYHVINMSYQSDVIDPVTGEPLDVSNPPNVESAAVTYAWSQGVVIIAAAGNVSNTTHVFPAALSEVIAVAATDRYDNLASFSSFGNTWVSMMAPGENIISTEPDISCELLVPGYVPGVDDCLTWKSGTSMASPHVAGAASLLWAQLYPEQSPGSCTASSGMPCNTVVRAILEGSADNSGALAQNFLAWSQNGRLNLYNMLADGDGDGILSPADNCLDIANNPQINTDGDPQGNACDPDDDNDGLSDDDETGLYGTNPLLEDTDGDGVNDGLEIEAGTDPLLETSFPILYTGDVNNDGDVNAADLIIAMRILLGEIIATPLQLARLDVAPLVSGTPTPDGQYNSGDYSVLVQKVTGLASF